MAFRTYNEVCHYIQDNPEVTPEEIAKHIPLGLRDVDVLLDTLKYMINSPVYFKSEDGVTWEEVVVPVGIKRGEVDMLDGVEFVG